MYFRRLKSVRAQRGWLTSICNAAGTAKKRVTPTFSMASNTPSGVNSAITLPHTPPASAMKPRPVPPMCAQGIATITTSSSSQAAQGSFASWAERRRPKRLRLLSSTPLGWPVVPEV
jgi:hypothetical protein